MESVIVVAGFNIFPDSTFTKYNETVRFHDHLPTVIR